MRQLQEHGATVNRILLALSPETFERLQPALEPVNLVRGQVIDHVNGLVDHLYFVTRGLVSVIKTMRDGRSVEIGATGIEGITNPGALLGIDRAPLETIVQVPGSALRIRVDILHEAMQRDEALRALILNYARFAVMQLAQTAACNRLHVLEARCCRWLLIAHDSALSDTFPLTHEFLAMMLGVQRAGVSIAANTLRQVGLIHYAHGLVTITNRRGLEHAACECYRSIRVELDALFRAKPDLGSNRTH